MRCENWPHGENISEKSAKCVGTDKAELSWLIVAHSHYDPGQHTYLPRSRWLYGQDEPAACPCFCPAICKAFWDMTNGVLCLKDCGVWSECSLGRGEVNDLGLNSYFVPLWGPSQQTGEESDASWTGCIYRSLWKKQTLFVFLSAAALTLLCSIWNLHIALESNSFHQRHKTPISPHVEILWS